MILLFCAPPLIVQKHIGKWSAQDGLDKKQKCSKLRQSFLDLSRWPQVKNMIQGRRRRKKKWMKWRRYLQVKDVCNLLCVVFLLNFLCFLQLFERMQMFLLLLLNCSPERKDLSLQICTPWLEQNTQFYLIAPSTIVMSRSFVYFLQKDINNSQLSLINEQEKKKKKKTKKKL